MSAKAHVVQLAGGKALILLNSPQHMGKAAVPQISDGAQQPMCEANCSHIHIPSMLLSREESHKMLTHLQKSDMLKLQSSAGRMDLWADLIDLKHGSSLQFMDKKQLNHLLFDLVIKHHPESIWVCP